MSETTPPAKENTLASFIMESHNHKGPVSADLVQSYADQYEDAVAEGILVDGLDDLHEDLEDETIEDYPAELDLEELMPDVDAQVAKHCLANDIIDYKHEPISQWPGRFSDHPKRLKHSKALIRNGKDETEIADLPALFDDVTLHYSIDQIISYMTVYDRSYWVADPFSLQLPVDLVPPPDVVPADRLDDFVMCRNLSIAGLQKCHQEDKMLNLMLNFCKANGWYDQVAQSMALDIFMVYTIECGQNPDGAEQIAMDSVMSAYRWEFQRQFPSLMEPLSQVELSNRRSAIQTIVRYRESYSGFVKSLLGNNMQNHNQPLMVQATDQNGNLMWHQTPHGQQPVMVALDPQQQTQQQPQPHVRAYDQALQRNLPVNNSNPPPTTYASGAPGFQRRTTTVGSGGGDYSNAARSLADDIINKTTRRERRVNGQQNMNGNMPNDTHHHFRCAMSNLGFANVNQVSQQQIASLKKVFGNDVPKDMIEIEEVDGQMTIVYGSDILECVDVPPQSGWSTMYNSRMFDRKYYFDDQSGELTEVFIPKKDEDLDYKEHELKAQLPDTCLATAMENRMELAVEDDLEDDEEMVLKEAVFNPEVVYSASLEEAVFSAHLAMETNDAFNSEKVDVFTTKAWVVAPYLLSDKTMANEKLKKTLGWLTKGSNLKSFEELAKLLSVLRVHAMGSNDMFLHHMVEDIEERTTYRFNCIMRHQLNLPADLNNFVDDYPEFINETVRPQATDQDERGLWVDAGVALRNNEKVLMEQMKFILPSATATEYLKKLYGDKDFSNAVVIGSLKIITNSSYCNDLMGMSNIYPDKEDYKKNGSLVSQKAFPGLYSLAYNDLAMAENLAAEVVYVPADGKPISLFKGLYNPNSVIAICK